MIKLPIIRPELLVPRRVAVVGSGPGVLKAELGAEIDAFRCIIRFNRAPHEGWEEHVGSRTDIRYVNEGVFRCKPHHRYPKLDKNFMQRVRNTTIIVPWKWSQARYNTEKKNTHSSNRLRFLRSVDLTAYLASRIKYRDVGGPTAGYAMLGLLISAGVEVHAYAFSLDNCMGHYWEPRADNTSPCHRIDKERETWQMWRDTGKVVFHE